MRLDSVIFTNDSSSSPLKWSIEMKKYFSATIAVCFSLFMIIGCGDKSTSPSGGSGLNKDAGTLDSHAGTNTPVKDSATAASVGTSLQSLSMAAGGKAMSLKKMANIKAGATGELNGTINGTNSGTATVSGSYEYDQTSGEVNYEMVCTFNNYSEDGKIFLGGQIGYVVDMSFDQTAGTMSGIYTITGKIRFNGTYIGSNDFNCDISMSGTKQSYTYSSTIVSDGVTTTIKLSKL